MKTLLTLLAIIYLLTFTACVPSLHPFYLEKDVVFDKAILGRWADAERKESWIFERSAGPAYRMTYTDENGKTGRFEAHLFKLGGRLFLDIVPIRPADEPNGYLAGHFVSTHTFVGIRVDGNAAQLSYMDPVWLKHLLAKNPEAVAHANIDGEVILTDTTRNMQNFLKTHLRTEGAFERSDEVFKQGEN